MNDWTKLNAIKGALLVKRRQRIRRSTYAYVGELIVEDTVFDHPFRDRMVVDWWHRIVDPLEAETFDAERLRYFRERLDEHRRSPAINAALRQELAAGKKLRRLGTAKHLYMRHQIHRLADRRLNYAAAKRAVEENDQAFERLVIGLVALPRLTPGPNSFLDRAARTITTDMRSATILKALEDNAEQMLPGLSSRTISERLSQIKDRYNHVWLFPDDYVSRLKEASLIRKLEEEYLLNFN